MRGAGGFGCRRPAETMQTIEHIRHFIHYQPHGDFEHGIFVPYATREEAERQVAYDLMHGVDPEYIEKVFMAPYLVPRWGWLGSDVQANGLALAPHLDSNRHDDVMSHAKLVKHVERHFEKLFAEPHAGAEQAILEHHERLRRGTEFKAAVPGNAYSWSTGGTATAVPAALSAATAKTLVHIVSAASNQPAIVEFGISFDGVTSSAVPVLVELVSGTGGTAGTPRSALAAMKQERGWPAQTSQTTAADTYSGEPGTQLVNRKWFISPNGGVLVIQFPLGREPTGIVTATTDGKTWSIRATAPATVNAHAYIHIEE